MGLEYKIETYDLVRTELPEFLRRQPEFLGEDGGTLQFGHEPSKILLSVKSDGDFLYVCQHVASRETDALLGLIVRRLLSLNDHVVISEL